MTRMTRRGVTEPQRVLIVEDGAQIAAVLTETLQDEGYVVQHAPNGAAGLQLLGQWAPDVILLDLMMPVLDGPGFRAVQQTLAPPLGTLPVIVLSGAHDAHAQAEALTATAVIAKPFDLDELLVVVAAACQRR